MAAYAFTARCLDATSCPLTGSRALREGSDRQNVLLHIIFPGSLQGSQLSRTNHAKCACIMDAYAFTFLCIDVASCLAMASRDFREGPDQFHHCFRALLPCMLCCRNLCIDFCCLRSHAKCACVMAAYAFCFLCIDVTSCRMMAPRSLQRGPNRFHHCFRACCLARISAQIPTVADNMPNAHASKVHALSLSVVLASSHV